MSFANESTASWFNSYLTDRYHAAKYCDAVFDKRKLLSCVPQGSILGRILFVIYIKSLLDAIVPGPAIAYTDDITLISPGSSPAQAALNAIATLSMIRDCSRDNGLFLNPAMCSNMLITPWRTQSANPAAELILDHSDSRIKSVSELRILGVTLTVDFKWSVYARNTCRSITKMVVVLNRFGCSPNIDSRCHNFNASIRPKWFTICQCGVTWMRVLKMPLTTCCVVLQAWFCTPSMQHWTEILFASLAFCLSHWCHHWSNLQQFTRCSNVMTISRTCRFFLPLQLTASGLHTTQDSSTSCKGIKPHQMNYVFTTRQPNFRTIYLSLFICYKAKLCFYRK